MWIWMYAINLCLYKKQNKKQVLPLEAMFGLSPSEVEHTNSAKNGGRRATSDDGHAAAATANLPLNIKEREETDSLSCPPACYAASLLFTILSSWRS
jgi:hypothetical protein